MFSHESPADGTDAARILGGSRGSAGLHLVRYNYECRKEGTSQTSDSTVLLALVAVVIGLTFPLMYGLRHFRYPINLRIIGCIRFE